MILAFTSMVRAGFDKGFQLLLGLGGIEQRVVLHRFLHLVVALVGGVLLQHVEDEAFSSMACFMEYRWNGLNLPSAAWRPNFSSVAGLGVAVNAK
jgi:hypothetical protein